MLQKSIEELVKEIRLLEEKRLQACKLLAENGVEINSPDVLDKKIVLPVKEKIIGEKIAAVDGGIVSQEMHSLDLLLVRACAVVFEYKNGRVEKHFYYPNSFPVPEVKKAHSLQCHEFSWKKAIARLRSEVSCALQVLEKFSPNALLLDGSIVPQPSDKPNKESQVHEEYCLLVEEYKELYEKIREKNCLLIGVIKDSRGRHLLELLQKHVGFLKEFREVLEKSNDTILLSYLLEENERSFAFNYSAVYAEHPILKEFGEWSGKINCFYLKPAPFDRPLRIEFLNCGDKASSVEEAACLVNSLSKGNKKYAYPFILIEADLRAAIESNELEAAKTRISSKLGFSSEILPLRRDSRPFR